MNQWLNATRVKKHFYMIAPRPCVPYSSKGTAPTVYLGKAAPTIIPHGASSSRTTAEVANGVATLPMTDAHISTHSCARTL